MVLDLENTNVTLTAHDVNTNSFIIHIKLETKETIEDNHLHKTKEKIEDDYEEQIEGYTAS